MDMYGGRRWEGRQREKIAAFLLATPAVGQSNSARSRETAAVFRRLWRVETAGVLRSRGQSRRMRSGDLAALTASVLYSAGQVLQGSARHMSVVVPVPCPAVMTQVEPRLLQIGIVALLREGVRKGSLTAVMEAEPGAVCLHLHSRHRWHRSRALLLAKETARLHGGSLTVKGHEIRMCLDGHRPPVPDPYPLPGTYTPAALATVGLYPLTVPYHS